MGKFSIQKLGGHSTAANQQTPAMTKRFFIELQHDEITDISVKKPGLLK